MIGRIQSDLRWRRLTLSAMALALFGAAGTQEDLRSLVYQAPPEGYLGLQGRVKIYDRSYAVVIGVSEYRELPDLPGAVRDARAIADLLKRHQFQVKLLLDGEASRVAVARVLGDELPRELNPNDRVLVYFAGHGITSGSPQAPMGYLMPADGSNDNRVSTGISMRELQAWFSAYPSKHVLFLADACYSGLALTTRSAGVSPTLRDYLSQVTGTPVRVAVTAGRSDQEAHEWRGHGLFTFFLLEGLKGAADGNHDGILTSSELYAYLEPNVAQTALANWSVEQNPQIGRSGQGEFVFLLDPRQPPQPADQSARSSSEDVSPTVERRSAEPAFSETGGGVDRPDRGSAAPRETPSERSKFAEASLRLPDFGDGLFANFSKVLLPSTQLSGLEVMLRGAEAEINPASVRLELNGHSLATFSAVNPMPRGVRIILRLDKFLRPELQLRPTGQNLLVFEASDEDGNVHSARFALRVDDTVSFPKVGGRLEDPDSARSSGGDAVPGIAWLDVPRESGEEEILVGIEVRDQAGLRRVTIEVNGKDVEEIVLQNGVPFRKRGGFRSSGALPGSVEGDGNRLRIAVPLKLRKGFNSVSVRVENVLGLRTSDQITVKRRK